MVARGVCLVEGFILATFTAGGEFKRDLLPFLHDGGTFESLRSLPWLILLR